MNFTRLAPPELRRRARPSSATTRALRASAAALGLLGLLLIAPHARGQAPEDAPDAAAGCDQSDDLKRKACLARALETAESDLSAARAQLKRAAANAEGADPRAGARVDTARGEWRSWREAECNMRAALAQGGDRGEAQLACALSLTKARHAHFTALAAGLALPMLSAEVEGNAGSAPGDGGVDAPLVAEQFRAWTAACAGDGACTARTSVTEADESGEDRERYALIIAKSPDGALSMAIAAPGQVLHPARPITVQVDRAPRITFAPVTGHASGPSEDTRQLTNQDANDVLVAQLREGARARADFSDTSGVTHTANFNLYGVTAALAWMASAQGR